eukprot:403371827
MDKRRLKKVENELQIEQEKLTIEDIVNSKKVNTLLLDKCEELFTLEFNLKQKAQLKYLQVQQQNSKKNRMWLLEIFTHEYLWSPTPLYYATTLLVYFGLKRKYKLMPYTIIPFMAIPATLDYTKREFYVGSFKEEKKRLSQTRKIVHNIVQEKKKTVSFEQDKEESKEKSKSKNQQKYNPYQKTEFKFDDDNETQSIASSHLNLPSGSGGGRQREASNGRKSTLQKFSKDVFIQHLEIFDYEEHDDHVEYHIKVLGRTKYLVNLNDLAENGLIDYSQIHKNSSNKQSASSASNSVSDRNLSVAQSNKNGNGDSITDSSNTNQDDGDSQEFQVIEYCIVKRYSELLIFSKLLQSEMKNYMKKHNYQPEDFPDFPPKKTFFNKTKGFVQKLPYTNAVIDLCQPFKLNLAVIGQKGSGKSALIESIVNVLVDYQKNRELHFNNSGTNGAFGGLGQSNQNSKSKNGQLSKLEELISQSNIEEPNTTGLTSQPLMKSKSDFVNNEKLINSLNTQLTTGSQQNNTQMNSDTLSQSIQSSQQQQQNQRSQNRETRQNQERQPRGQSKDNQRVAKLVFKKKERDRSLGENQFSEQGIDGTSNQKFKHQASQRKVEQSFPLDIAYRVQHQNGLGFRNLLFRLDIQEYQSIDEADLRSLLTHILSSEEKNMIAFTFDMTSNSSFKKYLKQALKDLIFAYEDLNDGSKERRMIPFMILGMKRDFEGTKKQKVSKDEVQKLMEVLKKHVNCEVLYTSAQNQEDILAALHQLFDQADDMYFHEVNKKLGNPNYAHGRKKS